MSKKALKYEPESLVKARKRYPESLEHLYNVHRIRYMGKPGPQFERANVFDFDTGLRLIISLEFAPLNKHGEKGPFEHISASWLSQPKHGLVPLDEVIRTYSYVSKRNPKDKPHWAYLDPETGVFHMLFRRDKDLTIEEWDEDGNFIEESLVPNENGTETTDSETGEGSSEKIHGASKGNGSLG